MKRTFFKLKINIPDLDKYGPENSHVCTLIYLTEYINEGDKTSFKIFYPEMEYLDSKLSWWHSKSEVDMLRYFEATKPISPVELVSVDFTGFECIGISNGSKYYEQFNSNEPALKYVIITTSGVRSSYSDVVDEPSEFYFNQSGFPIVEMNYEYPFEFPWVNTPYKLEPKNQIEGFIKFNKIEFRLEHHFFNTTKYDSSLVSIQKQPRMLVKHKELSEEEVRKQVLMLCTLFSFYSNTDIDYYVARTNTKDRRFYERSRQKKIESTGHGIFLWDFFRNPLNLIIHIDAAHLMANYDFVVNTVKRFNYGMKLSGESKFMILYNLLEQLRVQYINEKKIDQDKAGDPPKAKKVVDKYEFTQSNNQTDKSIKEALEKVSEIVMEEQREEFKKEISHKVENIKLMSMANQFKSLFDYTNIDPSICNLDFEKIKQLRNKIFHGNPVEEDESEYIEKICSYDRFPRFVGIMILKYFGIDDLKKVKKRYEGN